MVYSSQKIKPGYERMQEMNKIHVGTWYMKKAVMYTYTALYVSWHVPWAKINCNVEITILKSSWYTETSARTREVYEIMQEMDKGLCALCTLFVRSFCALNARYERLNCN